MTISLVIRQRGLIQELDLRRMIDKLNDLSATLLQIVLGRRASVRRCAIINVVVFHVKQCKVWMGEEQKSSKRQLGKLNSAFIHCVRIHAVVP